MRRLPLTSLASKVVDKAKEFARSYHSDDVESVHLLLGLLSVKNTVAYEILHMHGAKEEMFESHRKKNGTSRKKNRDFTPRVEEIMILSGQMAIKYGSKEIGTEHILLALIRDEENAAVRTLKQEKLPLDTMFIDTLVTIGIDYRTAKNEYMNGSVEEFFEEENPSVLDQYSTDLTQKAAEFQLDPMIGREQEMERLMQVLCRRSKNNPCFIGEPGVGKTAIVEGLAQRIVEGNVPYNLQNKRLLSLDLTRVIAGTKYRGEFEERMKHIVQEVEEGDDILLFIDEIHTMIGAGGSEGAMDASNILKPSLARGSFQVIGATTNEEYTKYFEKDAALARRFQSILVDEPTIQETTQIIEGIKYKFEEHHQVEVPHEVVDTIVTLSNRYINDRFLPDKAIDLLDEACAKKRISQIKVPKSVDEDEKQRLHLIEEIERCIREDRISEAKKMKEEKSKLEQKMERKQNRFSRNQNRVPTLTKEDVEVLISEWTKIPITELKQEEMKRLSRLEDILHKQVIGQNQAVTAVAKAIKRSRVGLNDPKKPIGSFLFLGPTGVGKTELSKCLAKAMFGSEEDLIRVDMSEYMEKHSVSKIIGSPPGYVGFGEGGQLSEQIRRHPYSVILFDEIEKAHPDVFNILLQVLDDGHITDSNGRKVDFKNTVIIMTSNAGANRIISPKQLGFTTTVDKDKNHEKMTAGVMEEVRMIFKPEFLNRIDDTIVFTVLTKDEVRKITHIFLKTLKQQLKENHGIELTVTKNAIDLIVEKGYDEKYGARPMKRVIQDELENVLADKILDGSLGEHQKIVIGKKDKIFTFTVK